MSTFNNYQVITYNVSPPEPSGLCMCWCHTNTIVKIEAWVACQNLVHPTRQCVPWLDPTQHCLGCSRRTAPAPVVSNASLGISYENIFGNKLLFVQIRHDIYQHRKNSSMDHGISSQKKYHVLKKLLPEKSKWEGRMWIKKIILTLLLAFYTIYFSISYNEFRCNSVDFHT